MSRRVLLLGWSLVLGFALIVVVAGFRVAAGEIQTADAVLPQPGAPVAPQSDEYAVLAWNDLGMHCYNRDFEYLAILPPANTLWVQVIKVGDPPQIVTDLLKTKHVSRKSLDYFRGIQAILDLFVAQGCALGETAQGIGVSSGKLSRFILADPSLSRRVNTLRAQLGLRPLK